ncbi:hypothetical protein D3C81_2072110 [compost metagenome]
MWRAADHSQYGTAVIQTSNGLIGDFLRRRALEYVHERSVLYQQAVIMASAGDVEEALRDGRYQH